MANNKANEIFIKLISSLNKQFLNQWVLEALFDVALPSPSMASATRIRALSCTERFFIHIQPV